MTGGADERKLTLTSAAEQLAAVRYDELSPQVDAGSVLDSETTRAGARQERHASS
jgi:hypothetical protein